MRRFACVIVFAAAVMAAYATGAREEESFTYDSIDHLVVQGIFLDIEVRGNDGSSVSMRSDLQDDSLLAPRNFSVRHEVSGSTLRVWVEKDGGIFTHGRGTLFFRVPAGTVVTVETASGDVRVNSLTTDTLEVRSASGDLEVADCDAPIIAGSISGDITLRHAKGDEDLTSVSGDVEMSDVEGRVSVKSISGSIRGTQILLTLDSLFKTISGDVDVDLRNALNELRYNLSTVSGDLQVGGVRSAHGLQMGTGGLLIKGETVSGSQTYR